MNDSCQVSPPSSRIDCNAVKPEGGWSLNTCETAGCCYDNTTIGVNSCFQPKGK